MAEIEWMNPPGVVKPDESWRDDVIRDLQRRPGKWARVDKGTRSRTRYKAWRKRGCETVTRQVTNPLAQEPDEPTHLYDIFARWPEPPVKVDAWTQQRRARNIPPEGKRK